MNEKRLLLFSLQCTADQAPAAFAEIDNHKVSTYVSNLVDILQTRECLIQPLPSFSYAFQVV
jgi:hypothetical protein